MNTAPRWEYRSSEAAPIALATSASGVAALFEDGSLELLRADGGREGGVRLPLRGNGSAPLAEVRAVNDGFIAAVPGEVALLRHTSGRTTRLAEGETDVACFAVNGEQVAVARHAGVELWTLANQCRWRAHGSPFVAVAFAGRTIVGIRADGEIVFLSLLKGAEQGTLKLAAPEPAHTWRIAAVDGARVAVAMGEWLVVVDGASQKVVRRTRARGSIVSISANEKRIVVGLADGWLQLFDAFTGEARGAVQAHADPVTCVALHGTTLLSAAAQGTFVRAWDESALQAASARGGAPVTALAGRGALVAVGDRSGRLRLLKGTNEAAALRLDGPITGVYLSESESVTAVTGSVVVRLEKPWKTPHPALLSAPATAFAVDDVYAFSGTESGSVEVVEMARGTQITSYALSEAAITALARLPGSKLVVGTGALDGRLFIVDVAEAKVVFRLEPHQEAFGVTALAAEPRGRLVASGSDDSRIALIDPAKGRVLAHVPVPETVIALAFDATGRKLACVLANGSSLIVSLDRKAAITMLPYRNATSAAWAEDVLLVGLADGQVERHAMQNLVQPPSRGAARDGL